MSDEKTMLSILHRLSEVGLWIQRKQDGSLIVGPMRLVQQHQDLIAEVRPYKEAISQLLEEQLVHSLFGEADDDARFESDVCPECQQTVYVIAPPDGGHTSTRRLAGHRLPDAKTVCRGGGLAATVGIPELLDAFLADRATLKPSALVTWRSVWTALRAWCYERQMLPLPAPEAVQVVLNARFTPCPMSTESAWGGLMLQQQAWHGDAKGTKPNKPRAMVKKKTNAQQKQVTLFA